MDGKDDKKIKMKGRTKKCKTKKRRSWSKETKTEQLRSLRNLQYHWKWESPSQHSYRIYFACLFVEEGPRKPGQGRLQTASEAHGTQRCFLCSTLLDLDLTRMFNSPLHLIKIGTNINCREKRVYPPFPWMVSCSCPSPRLFHVFYRFSGGVLMGSFWGRSPCLLLWDLQPDVGGRKDHCQFGQSILIYTTLKWLSNYGAKTRD